MNLEADRSVNDSNFFQQLRAFRKKTFSYSCKWRIFRSLYIIILNKHYVAELFYVVNSSMFATMMQCLARKVLLITVGVITQHKILRAVDAVSATVGIQEARGRCYLSSKRLQDFVSEDIIGGNHKLPQTNDIREGLEEGDWTLAVGWHHALRAKKKST